MATCDPAVLLADAKCLPCADIGQLMDIQLVLLKRILELRGGTFDLEDFMESAKCLFCADSGQLMDLALQLLCNIYNG